MISCTVCGHRDIDYNSYREKLTAIFNEIIEMYHAVKFYLGGYGAFDIICAHILAGIKHEYRLRGNERIKIDLILVVPYEYQYIDKCKNKGVYDEIIFPISLMLDTCHAIVNRNRYMVDNSDLVLTGVSKNNGGAYKTLCYAKQENKTIISIV